MDSDTKKKFDDYGRKVTMREPKVSVLSEEKYDQYILPVKSLDSCLKNKLKLKKLLLPELRNNGNETIAIYSDYGGEASDSAYYTYSFLVCGWNHSFAFHDLMTDLRKKYHLNDKEISFKDLKFGPVKRSLDEYLTGLHNFVPGLLVTIAIDKNIKSIFGDKLPEYVLDGIKDAGFGEWKPDVTEKVMRIVHCVSYLVALLSNSGQNIYWNTDNDSIVANPEKQGDFLNLFDSVLTLYTDNKFKNIGLSLPFDERSVRQIDLLSCADLAAGAVEHYFTNLKKKGEQTIKGEANKILEWLGRDGVALKKHTIIIEKKTDGKYSTNEVIFSGNISFNDSESILIPTTYKT